ncbi:hypothetical protein Ddye_009659 [Dipteronia dyeriana]|uniref:B box-type domain-containing protein n=1 Tax=Dipteronia dyeriana TaxID=168575 RepID=A0AAE0CMG8_9ROSI|nr:hypothetical protein Ddye_009659 [Dipteronia dyeriana]
MEPLCEYCGVATALVYCKSDLARLCLRCDGYVHSANFLSSRHNRSLLCDKCNSQPAIFRCMDDRISLCQGLFQPDGDDLCETESDLRQQNQSC